MRKKRKANIKQAPPVGELIKLFVIGLVLGSIFIFGSQYWGKPIQREDAISASATYESYQINRGRHRSIRQIILSFSDHPAVYIDGACVNAQVLDEIKTLPTGTDIDMLIHPNSDTVWELKTGKRTLISFEKSRKDIIGENTGFFVLGLFLYFCAAIALYALLVRWKRRQKKTENSR